MLKKAEWLFTITFMDRTRDGGTTLIKTTKDDIYLHMNRKDFHSSYPPNEENRIKDPLMINYIIHLMDVYIQREEDQIDINKNILGRVISNNNTVLNEVLNDAS